MRGIPTAEAFYSRAPTRKGRVTTDFPPANDQRKATYVTGDELSTIGKSIISDWSEAYIELPLEQTGLDSMDLMIMRSAIEAHLGHDIPDEDWFGTDRLADLLERIR